MLRQRIEAGIAWLDQEYPGWRERIDLETLDMEHSCYCILGQVDYSYARVCIKKSLSTDKVIDLGFYTTGTFYDYGVLTQEWKDALAPVL